MTFSHDPLGSNPISSQFHTCDGRGCFSFMSLGTDFGSRGFVGCSIERLGVPGDETVVLFELNLSQRFRISYVASSLSCCLIYLYIWSILWNSSHASIGSLCPNMFLLMLDTFTNPVLLLFLWLSWPSYIFFTQSSKAYSQNKKSLWYAPRLSSYASWCYHPLPR